VSAASIVDGRIRAGVNDGYISAITLAEILVRPHRAGRARAAEVTDAILLFPNLSVLDVSSAVASEGARIRAGTNLPLPDSLILATAGVHDIPHVVTNDSRWDAGVARAGLGLSLVHLGSLD
jgi:predicted nucleic acid-binding protein